MTEFFNMDFKDKPCNSLTEIQHLCRADTYFCSVSLVYEIYFYTEALCLCNINAELVYQTKLSSEEISYIMHIYSNIWLNFPPGHYRSAHYIHSHKRLKPELTRAINMNDQSQIFSASHNIHFWRERVLRKSSVNIIQTAFSNLFSEWYVGKGYQY